MGVRLLLRAAEGKALDDGPSYAFEQTRIVIGRGVGADVRIPHLTVSERHAVLIPQDAGYAIEDTGSTNGTLVNGALLPSGRRRTLREDDRIQVGAYELSFHSGVLVTEPVTAERTAELARRLFRQTARGSRVGEPRLVVVDGLEPGRSLNVPAPPARLLVGAAEHCQLALRDPEVEAEHLEVVRDLDGVLVREVHAHAPAQKPHRLRDGDELSVGRCRLLFEEPAEQPLQALGEQPDLAQPSAPPPKTEALPATAPADDEPPSATKSERGPPASLDADVIIYALAAIVMAVSIAGLFLLMGE